MTSSAARNDHAGPSRPKIPLLSGIQSLDSETVGRMAVLLSTVALWSGCSSVSKPKIDQAAVIPLTGSIESPLTRMQSLDVMQGATKLKPPAPPDGGRGVRMVVQSCTNLLQGQWIDVMALPPLPAGADVCFYRLKTL